MSGTKQSFMVKIKYEVKILNRNVGPLGTAQLGTLCDIYSVTIT